MNSKVMLGFSTYSNAHIFCLVDRHVAQQLANRQSLRLLGTTEYGDFYNAADCEKVEVYGPIVTLVFRMREHSWLPDASIPLMPLMKVQCTLSCIRELPEFPAVPWEIMIDERMACDHDVSGFKITSLKITMKGKYISSKVTMSPLLMDILVDDGECNFLQLEQAEAR